MPMGPTTPMGINAMVITLRALMELRTLTKCATPLSAVMMSTGVPTGPNDEDFAFQKAVCVMEQMIARMEPMSLSILVMPLNVAGTNTGVQIAHQEKDASID